MGTWIVNKCDKIIEFDSVTNQIRNKIMGMSFIGITIIPIVDKSNNSIETEAL